MANVDALEAWSGIAERIQRGESIPFIARGEHVGDIVPSGELERLRETIEVLSDKAALEDLRDTSTEDEMVGVEAVRELINVRRTFKK